MARAACLSLLLTTLLLGACGGDGTPSGPSTGGSSTGVGQGAGGGQGGQAGGQGGVGQGGEGLQGGGGTGQGGGTAVPLDGFGAISGECGVLDPAELMTSSPPFEIENAIDFGASAFDSSLLSRGGQTIYDDPNAGGSSKESEAIAFDVLYRCELAALLKTETEILYDTTGAITDFLTEVDGLKVGVSVVRAYAFMADYTVADAVSKMTEKLLDIQESSANVSSGDAWTKQILAVIAEKPENASAVVTALGMIDAATRGDTIVVITVTDGDDAFVY
jgi:hypothetical protein